MENVVATTAKRTAGPAVALKLTLVHDAGGLVADVAPALTVQGPGQVMAGAVYAITLASNDPGLDPVTQWRIDWGDGQVDRAGPQ